MSLEALVAQVQGLSGSAGDLSNLQATLKASDAVLRASAGAVTISQPITQSAAEHDACCCLPRCCWPRRATMGCVTSPSGARLVLLPACCCCCHCRCWPDARLASRPLFAGQLLTAAAALDPAPQGLGKEALPTLTHTLLRTAQASC